MLTLSRSVSHKLRIISRKRGDLAMCVVEHTHAVAEGLSRTRQSGGETERHIDRQTELIEEELMEFLPWALFPTWRKLVSRKPETVHATLQ